MLPAGHVLQHRYRVIRKLGGGGMGTVYEAVDERLATTVALKESHFDDERMSRQFEREARILAKLRHPALTRVIDHFQETSGQFLVMDYVGGADLFEALRARGEAFAVDEVLDWTDQLLDALAYLHTQPSPIIHRDIKPQNLKLWSERQIVLLDFGLAKDVALQSRLHSSGSIFGYTPNYAPLEQIQGSGTDPRSDLYSLAATAYHLLTGAKPPDVLTRLAATTDGSADPMRPASDVYPTVSVSVAQVFHRALSIGRSSRFGSALEMRDALRSARVSAPTIQRNPGVPIQPAQARSSDEPAFVRSPTATPVAEGRAGVSDPAPSTLVMEPAIASETSDGGAAPADSASATAKWHGAVAGAVPFLVAFALGAWTGLWSRWWENPVEVFLTCVPVPSVLFVVAAWSARRSPGTWWLTFILISAGSALGFAGLYENSGSDFWAEREQWFMHFKLLLAIFPAIGVAVGGRSARNDDGGRTMQVVTAAGVAGVALPFAVWAGILFFELLSMPSLLLPTAAVGLIVGLVVGLLVGRTTVQSMLVFAVPAVGVALSLDLLFLQTTSVGFSYSDLGPVILGGVFARMLLLLPTAAVVAALAGRVLTGRLR